MFYKMTRVYVSLWVEGFHRWPKAIPPVAFLRSRHRHLFKVEAWKLVASPDREVEIIQLKNSILAYMEEHKEHGEDSCERIAAEVLSMFSLDRCRVLEDGENGAEVSLET